MLSEALQRNAKHEARLSNISDVHLRAVGKTDQKFLRFAQNDKVVSALTLQRFNKSHAASIFDRHSMF
jgi:predicted MPP superfamily phosphohydrolase